LVAGHANGDADFITLTVPEGQQLVSAVLTNYEGGSNFTFLGIQVGGSVPGQAEIQAGTATLDGGTVYGDVQEGADLLALLATDTVENAGQPVSGLSLPLGPGTYTLWFNQNQGLSQSTIAFTTEPVPGPQVGEAVLDVTVASDDVQISNFPPNSFTLTNTGEKRITALEVDVTDALYPDAVFDPFGLAGDTVSKPLTLDTPGETGVEAPTDASYIGAGGADGFEGIRLKFDPGADGGFQPGETVGFSVDMDPNSVAGAFKGRLDDGASPDWDVGGVSGAELIGASFTVTFEDGSTATGTLQGAGNQGGARGLASQASPELGVALAVNGVTESGIGTYADGGPSVIVNGPEGFTARVVLTKGIIQPVVNNFSGELGERLDAQLADLMAAGFPANNAAEFQTVDIVLTGEDQDISSLFNFADVAGFDLPVDESRLPLGFVASVIDPANGDLPLGPVTSPIHVVFGDGTVPVADIEIADAGMIESGDGGATQVAFALSASVPIDGDVEVAFTASGVPGVSPASPVMVTFLNGSATLDVFVPNDDVDNGAETVAITLTGVGPGPGLANPVQLGADVAATGIVPEDDAALVEGDVLLRINAFGPELEGGDGGPDWLADLREDPIEYFSSLQDRGESADDPGSVPDGVPAELFEDSRISTRTINYDIPVADILSESAFYKVNLYFIDGRFTAPGERVFDTAIEGEVPAELDNLDLVARFGAGQAGVVSHVVAVTDGTLNLDFLTASGSGDGAVQNPLISGIEIIELVSGAFELSALTDTDGAANRVDETVAGARVGITVVATDLTPGATVSYGLVGPNADLFTVDANGVVRTAGALDRETDGGSVDIAVQAVSSAGGSVEATFVVAVNDVNEGPVGPITDSAAEANVVADTAAAGTAVGITAVAVDADATMNVVTYSLIDDAGGRFTIDPVSGVVSVLDAGLIDGAVASYQIEVEALSEDLSVSMAVFDIAVSGTPGVGAQIGTGLTEIEDLDLTDYGLEQDDAASGGTLVKTFGEGLASGVFTGATGAYDVEVRYYNEDDGVATWTLLVDGIVRASWDGVGGEGVTGSPETIPFEGLTLEAGDVITFEGLRDGGELARLDAVTITAADVGPVNTPPVVELPLPDQGTEEGESFSFEVPAETFSDADGDTLMLGATQANGDPLPDWLVFDPDTETFSGTPGEADVGGLEITVTASDGEATVADTFTLTIAPNIVIDGPEIGVGLTEVEDLDLSGYDVQRINEASGRFVVRTYDEGMATGVFSGPTGAYDLQAVFFNESDGEATWSVLVNGVEAVSWQGIGGTSAGGTAEAIAFADIDLQTGDVITIHGIRGNDELARIDAFSLTPAAGADGGGGPTPPPSQTVIAGTSELETFALDGYEVESRDDGSNGTAIRTFGTGIAAASFVGSTGVYGVDIVYFDESDGVSTWQLLVNGEEVDTWQGDGGTTAVGTPETRAVLGVSLADGDVIELVGIAGDPNPFVDGAEEMARLDTITITPNTQGNASLSGAMTRVDPALDQSGQVEPETVRAGSSEGASGAGAVDLSGSPDGFVFETSDLPGLSAHGHGPLEGHDGLMAALEDAATAVPVSMVPAETQVFEDWMVEETDWQVL
ncbi:MAG: putative Ig domain-containing protein, partial [Pseudomonadota bacterium]